MEVPPKSDEESNAPDDATGESVKAKRPARSRLYRSKKRGAVKEAGPEVAESSAVPPPAPVAPEPPPPAAPEPAPAAPDGAATHASTHDNGAPDQGQTAAEGGYNEGGNGGQFQHGGKFGRRGRGKHFRPKWGGNQNFQGPKHPPQPGPPKEVVHYGDLPDPARFQDLAALEKLADEIAGKEEPVWLCELYSLNLADLTAYARKLEVKFEGAPNRRQLITQIFQHIAEHKVPLYDRGYIDMTDRGLSFVVHEDVNYRLYPEDAFLPEIFIKHFGLKRGHAVEVQLQPPQGNDRCPAVVAVRKVMGGKPSEISKIPPFEELTPYYPLKRIILEQPGAKDVSMRMVDIITPVGFGQRGLIVAPPRTGKTILMQNMANSIAANSPEAKLIILLVDERPEEVTDFKRHCKGEVVSSTFDETPESHVHCAEMVIEKARRLVEHGEHVVILLDSITRLARAYNALASNSGKIMSGGLESNALQKPKRFFGSARNIEGAGSLTILGTALVDTGSRMDEIIFEEFKGTGNMELHLDRDLVNKRIFPALNIDKSGTRKEELIYHPDELLRVYALRRAMQGVPAADSLDMLIQRLKKTKTNAEFLLSLNR
ncbi:MAG TPA: transcription termination factor Rho [Lacunisphaera sp.]|jgi:transcription termination factor Rho|nr:transcription termination factor Rho [Lacunisphaera sp.]